MLVRLTTGFTDFLQYATIFLPLFLGTNWTYIHKVYQKGVDKFHRLKVIIGLQENSNQVKTNILVTNRNFYFPKPSLLCVAPKFSALGCILICILDETNVFLVLDI